MALQAMSAEQLAQTPTLFASFMGRVDRGYTTFAELLAIYRERSRGLLPAEDQADDLRVERFKRDMARGGWSSDVILRVGVFDGTLLAIDGIHRGIAYLACLEEGVSPARLPALQVNR
jgi:hypothetical protein